LIDRNADARLGIEHAAQTVRFGPERDTGDVAQVHDVATIAHLDDDVGELSFAPEPPLSIYDVLELGPGQRWLSADLARSDLSVLLAHGLEDVVRRHAARGDLAGVEPQPHRVVARAKHAHIAHAG
jgi:hypothetical protein